MSLKISRHTPKIMADGARLRVRLEIVLSQDEAMVLSAAAYRRSFSLEGLIRALTETQLRRAVEHYRAADRDHIVRHQSLPAPPSPPTP